MDISIIQQDMSITHYLRGHDSGMIIPTIISRVVIAKT